MPLPTKSVLWVDDEAEMLEPHRMFLRDKGFEVETATNADDAVEMVRLRVRPAAQRRGYGATVVSALEERAAEYGYRVLRGDTTELQAPALALYRKFGWRETRREVIGGIVNIYIEKELR